LSTEVDPRKEIAEFPGWKGYHSINSSKVFTTSLPGRAAMDVNVEVFVAKARTLHNACPCKNRMCPNARRYAMSLVRHIPAEKSTQPPPPPSVSHPAKMA
jgi:hypothetical protein